MLAQLCLAMLKPQPSGSRGLSSPLGPILLIAGMGYEKRKMTYCKAICPFGLGVGLEKDLGAVVSYAVQDAFGFPVVDVPPQGTLRDLGAFPDVPEVCTAFGLQGNECQGLDGLHVLPKVYVLYLGRGGLIVPLRKIIAVFKDLLSIILNEFSVVIVDKRSYLAGSCRNVYL